MNPDTAHFKKFLDEQLELMLNCYDTILDNAMKHHTENCTNSCRDCELDFMFNFLLAFTARMDEMHVALAQKMPVNRKSNLN